jgi:hypothetical protein
VQHCDRVPKMFLEEFRSQWNLRYSKEQMELVSEQVSFCGPP